MRFTPLDALLFDPRPLDQALTTDGKKTWGDLLRSVSGYERALCQQESGAKWLILCPTPSAFIAAIFACWRRNLCPVIAPDALQHIPSDLTTRLAGVLCESPEVAPDWRGPRHLLRSDTEIGKPAFFGSQQLELFSSGSSGARKAILKGREQLDRELAVHRALWPERGRTVATVSHFHIYGLLVRLLRPLCEGQPFPDSTPFHLDELFAELSQPGPKRLVSSPTHLRLLAQCEALTCLQDTQIFSSGAPLPRETALAIAAKAGTAPIEVLGSTETGGIAWRVQSAARDESWTPLPGVQIQVNEGLLAIGSPWSALDSPADEKAPEPWVFTGDRAALTEEDHQRFQLLGRADRLLKLGEKRIALAELERRLLEHPCIARVQVLCLPTHAGRERLGALVQLSPEGEGAWLVLGPKALFHEWRQWLAPLFPPLAWPKNWRILHDFPLNAQGKSTQASILAAFQNPQPRYAPLVLARRIEPDKLQLDLHIPSDFHYFQGHFPAVPIVAGVCQLKWVQDSLGYWLQTPVKLQLMEAIKFRELLLAEQNCTLELLRGREPGRFSFRIFSASEIFSMGRLQLEAL